jgi:hypothetical protein
MNKILNYKKYNKLISISTKKQSSVTMINLKNITKSIPNPMNITSPIYSPTPMKNLNNNEILFFISPPAVVDSLSEDIPSEEVIPPMIEDIPAEEVIPPMIEDIPAEEVIPPMIEDIPAEIDNKNTQQNSIFSFFY